MHTRRAALLKDLLSFSMAECPTIQSASGENLGFFKQSEIQVMPVEFLQHSNMPEADLAYICIADVVFKSDLAASVVVKTFSHGGQVQLKTHASRKPMVEKLEDGCARVDLAESWFLRKFRGISLERVAKAMKDCMARESCHGG